MNESEREQLAQRLSAMSLKEASREVRNIDPDADLKFYRNSIWDEYHTLWVLPQAQLSIILVEKANVTEAKSDDFSAARGRRKNKNIDFQYVEARVEELDRPASKI